MNALIDPTSPVKHVVAWDTQTPPQPIFSTYPNSARVCEVSATEFLIAPPLFWTPCADTIVPDEYWYNTETGVFAPVESVPPPPVAQPAATGVQTL